MKPRPAGFLRTLVLTIVAIFLAHCGGGGGGGESTGIGLEDLNQDGAIRLLCFGDSITRGTGDGPNARETPPLPAGYPARLQGLLGVPVDNAGRPGERISSGVNRFPAELERFHPDYVILQEGINDIPEGHGRDIVPSLREMIGATFRAGALPIIGTLLPTCCGHSGPIPESAVRDINRDIVGLSLEQSVPLIDFFAAFVPPAPDGSPTEFDPSSGLIHDPEGLHPTPAGYDLMAMTAARAF